MAPTEATPAATSTMTPEADTSLAADSYAGGDSNSAYDSEIASYTTSLSSSAMEFRHQAGRRFHAYADGSYAFPNDEKEADRLDIMHQMAKVSMGNKLFFAPVKSPKRVLDLGTGTGVWATELGDEYPDADILGNDLSPIQPRWIPPNVHFEVDDVEKPWTFSKKFDFIHSRMLYGAIKDWPALVKQAFDNTTPGGYCEFNDIDAELMSPDMSVPEGSPLYIQNTTLLKLLKDQGTEPCPGKFMEGWFKDVGFEDIHVKYMPVPVGTWPKDKHLKEVGSWMFLQAYEGMESFITYLFSTVLNWTKEEIDVFSTKLRKQMKDPKVHSMVGFYSVYGRKPLEKTSESAVGEEVLT